MRDPQVANRTPLGNDTVGSLVGEFMEEKRRERQEEKARQAPKKRNPLVIPLLVLLCAGIWTTSMLMPAQTPVLTHETLEQSARLSLYLASLRVREYVAANKRLPANLLDAGVDTTGITFTRASSSHFELSTTVQGSRLVYRSTMPDSAFLGPRLHIRGIS
ncbi:MAG TPA: hypothetical protein VFZ51_05405 [Woeseiaceae bacterium]